MKYSLVILQFFVFCAALQAQEADSSARQELPEITITAFDQQKSRLSTVSSLVAVSLTGIDRSNKTSLVGGLNSIAGVRMEERSPGSYRLNIRGSSLRAPFGVRNVKVYWNDIPVTDAGGGTYLNQFAFNNIVTVEIAKGPAGNLYGAGTGGLLLLKSIDGHSKPGIQIDLAGGSFGLQNLLTSAVWGENKSQNQLSYAHQKADGYRNHTYSKKDNLSYTGLFKVSDRQEIQASVLFNHQFYETPGGLNATEFANNPRQERPAAGGFPSASTAKAAIEQTNFVAGLSNTYRLSEKLQNTTVLFGTFNHIKNPTFRNYERRIEPGFGARSVFSADKNWNQSSLRLTAGAEVQQAYYNTTVSKNRGGNPDTVLTNDDINLTAYSLFIQGAFEFGKNWSLTAGTSLNKSTISIRRLNIYPVTIQKRTYRNEFAPRLSLVKQFGSSFAVSGTFSQGFSPPTLSEVLPSTGEISTFLEAERGTNYEIGARLNLLRSTLKIDLTAFYFKLVGALVLRRDINNADFFMNAGDVQQKGIEASAQYFLNFKSSASIFSNLVIRTGHSIYQFKYGDYRKDVIDYNGKKLPGVPSYTGTLAADLRLKAGIDLSVNLYHASSIYLNDANTIKDPAYTIAGIRLSYNATIGKLSRANLYFGIDNLFDEVYSLGNDINAAGGRYYNVAPSRNWYVGIQLNRKK